MSSKPGFWRKCRIAFRCARFTVWGLVLLGLLAFGWFNLVGLPGFLKTRLVTAMHERGVQLGFSRLRLRVVHGLVCDNVRVGVTAGGAEPVFTAREVQLRIDYPALLHLHLQVDGLVLRDGRLNLSPAPDHALVLTNLQGQLRILPDDTWSLDELTGGFAGTQFKLGGELAHAPECRRWQIFAVGPAPERGSVEASLEQFSDTLKQIHFAGVPRINARLSGDARDVHSCSFRISGRAPGVETPWFGTSNLEFAVQVLLPTNAPAVPNPAWDYWTNLQPFQIAGFARCTNLKAGGLRAETVDCAGTWAAPELAVTQCSIKLDRGTLETTAKLNVDTRELTFATASTFDLRILAPLLPEQVRSRLDLVIWKTPPHLQVSGSFVTPAWTNQDADWSAALIAGSRLQGDVALTNLVVAGVLPLDSFHTHFNYAQQTWSIQDLVATRGRSTLALNAEENGTNQDFHCQVGGTVESGLIRSFLTTSNAVHTFDHLRFRQPVALALDLAGNFNDLSRLALDGRVTATNFASLHVNGSLVLPALTNHAAQWSAGLGAASKLQGDLTLTNLMLAGLLPLDSVRAQLHYDRQIWSVQDLKISRGRTTLAVDAEENETNRDFHCRVSGQVDPNLIRPWLNTNAARAFDYVHFHEPVALSLELGGNLLDFSTLTATGRVALTNFAVREQSLDSLTATLSYTNLTAEFYHPQLVRAGGTEQFVAERATLDLAGQKLWLHEGRGRVQPAAVIGAIGPQTTAVMEPYHFLAIPEAFVDGCIPLKFQDGDLVTDDADLRFNVIGTLPFRWRKFETPAITGTIHWLGHDLILTNVTAACYGGTAHGWGVFDLETPGDGTDFSFFMAGTNVDLNAMGRALWSPTNLLRGALSAQLTVTSANSSDWRTWNGYGQAQLHNGLLWDAPVLGLMSQVLNTFTPGLDIGNSRATDAAGSFTMTNGVIFTDSVEIRSLTMRFDYVGTVDLQENVTARVQAQLLRNTPVLGLFVSTVLLPFSKALECDVTGTLDQPKIKPAYIPFSQYLSAPLHPIRTVEKIFSSPSTNGPPKT